VHAVYRRVWSKERNHNPTSIDRIQSILSTIIYIHIATLISAMGYNRIKALLNYLGLRKKRSRVKMYVMWRLKGGVENGKGFDTHANCLGAGFLFAG
jgi:hypothetical protein